MNYEERYTAALERAKKLQDTCDSQSVVGWCEYIFPELQESEDGKNKRISKEITQFLKQNNGWNREWLAWLENQGKQEPYGQRKECEDCQFNYVGECKGFCQMKRDEQKHVDKVEPKFHKGDWIVCNGLTLYVKEVVNGFYRTISKGGIINSYDWDIDNIARLWTIQDAVDGDVLSVKIEDEVFIVLFNQIHDRWIITHCCYSETTSKFIEGAHFCYHYRDLFMPATKEQRDILKMSVINAGYEWNSEKKELKKIEHKMLDAILKKGGEE